MGSDSKKERINTAFGYLYNSGAVHSITDLAEKMGRARPGVSNALNGNEDYLNDKFLAAFAKRFANVFNEDWVLYGSGPMLVNQNEEVVNHVPDTKGDMIEAGDAMRRLLEANESMARDLRAFNEKLQKAIVDRDATISSRDRTISTLQQQIAVLNSELKRYIAGIYPTDTPTDFMGVSEGEAFPHD